mgnify:CR=1 FL=1
MKVLEVKKISKSFGGVKAVNNCSFEIEERKITALIGPNGAGKTTLFNIINGFIEPEAGIITFQNLNITTLPAWRRSRLGMSRTFQLSRLFKNLSIRENLLLAGREGDDLFFRNLRRWREAGDLDQKIREASQFVGLKKDLNAGVTDISYGEQKLFDLTRALVNPHTLLLLDEVVAGVNPVIREQLKELMRKLKAKGETILLIEHDMDFVRSVADYVIVMDQGSVLTEGEPEKVLKEKKVLEAYLGTAN